MIKGDIVAAGLLVLCLMVAGHAVAEDNECIDLLALHDASVWNLVNTCPYAVDVVWCSLSDVSAALECGGEPYFKDLRTVGPNGRVATGISLTQDLYLEYGACRTDYDQTGFNGIDVGSMTRGGLFKCRKFGQQPLDWSEKLVGGSGYRPEFYADSVNAIHCIKPFATPPGYFSPQWYLVNRCSYDVRVMLCARNTQTDIPECGDSEIGLYYGWGMSVDANDVTTVSSTVPVAAELDLEIAACRMEFDDQDVVLYGFDRTYVNADGSFTCFDASRDPPLSP